MTFRAKTIFISGASRGIGLAIARRLARDGANIILAAKTAEPHPKLPGTVFSAAKEIVALGGKALPLVCDIRDEEQAKAAVAQGVAAFGGIDVCINNASAISLTGTLATEMKRYDLMSQVNARGTFLCSKLTLPHLLKAANPHILNLSPPLDLDPKWFANHVAYTTAKYGMSLCTLGMAAEFRGKVGVNSLWPITSIDTAAVRFAARRRRHGRRQPHAGDHGRRRLRGAVASRRRVQRQLLHRRGSASRRRRQRLLGVRAGRGRHAAAGRLLRSGCGVRSLADADQARVLTTEPAARLRTVGSSRSPSAATPPDILKNGYGHSMVSCPRPLHGV